MNIGFRKTSLVDYPGKVAGVLFFPGCGLRCPWCFNRDLVLGEGFAGIELEDALKHLEKRRAVLGGAVLSGGEATRYNGLPGLIQRIKGLGLSVKLDTNGMEPAMLERLFQNPETSPDYIALDLKTAPEKYALLGGLQENPATRLKTSAALIHAAGIPHEYRTLGFPNSFIIEKDIEALAPLVDAEPWYFRRFQPGNCLDPAWDSLGAAEPSAAEALARSAARLGKRGLYVSA